MSFDIVLDNYQSLCFEVVPSFNSYFLTKILLLFYSDLDIRFHIIGSGSLSVENVIESDAGTYMCRAQNSEDSVDSSATVDILGKK